MRPPAPDLVLNEETPPAIEVIDRAKFVTNMFDGNRAKQFAHKTKTAGIGFTAQVYIDADAVHESSGR